jgi:LuxR family maltose regulon positive regulatory protein
MPKAPVYTLAWSPATEEYELYQTRDHEGLGITPESPAWFAWLDRVSSFAFAGKSGRYTARKEAKQRGSGYWSAYLATGEQLSKKYLGKTTSLTLTRLEYIASLLCTQSKTQISPRVSDAGGTKTKGETQHSVLPQGRHPLNHILATKLHMPRLRTHLVPRAHLGSGGQRPHAFPLLPDCRPANA